MEPAFYRGDLLFLTNPVSERYHTGDITVYKIPGADIPIVHRVLETHDIGTLTKVGYVVSIICPLLHYVYPSAGNLIKLLGINYC